MLLFALFKLAFASAPRLHRLTSQHIVTRRPVLQKVRDHACPFGRCALSACKHMVSGSLSLPSRGSFHLSLTVLFSIGHQVVFSLGRWASRLPTEFLVLHGTLLQIASVQFRLQGFYLVSPGFPRRFVYFASCTSLPQNISAPLSGSYPFARHYSGNRWFTFSSSGYLDGSVPRVPLLTLCVHVRIPKIYFGCVPAFGYLRIDVCLRLPAAFRSLPRPSSAPDAFGILHTLFIA